MLAALYKISDSSIALAVFFQHLLGTCSAGLVYMLAREYFSPRVALTAGIGAALYWPFVYFEGDILIVSTFIFLNTLALFFFAKAQKQNSLRWFAAAGFAIGLSAIARPSILVLYPVIPLFIYLTARGGPPQAPTWVRRTVVVAAAASIAIMPVMIRNFVVAQAVVPVAASGGVNFYIGNNPASDGSTAIVPGTRADWWGGYEDAIAIAEAEMGKELGLSEVSDFYFKRGMAYLSTQPESAWPHMFRKLRVFWSGPERANNKFIYFFWHLAGMKYVPLPGFGLVAPLGLLGMFVLWHRRRELAMLYLFVFLYSFSVVAFFVNARFRLPIMPIMIMFASYGAFYVISAYRKKSLQLVKALVVLAAATLIVNAEFMWFHKVRAYSNAISNYTLGNAYLKMGLKDTALGHFQIADAINQENPTNAYELIARDVNYNMGVLLWESAMCTRAIEILEKVGGSDIYAINALDKLGDCYLRRRELDNAYDSYSRLRRIDPDDVRGPTGHARCYAAGHNYPEAEKLLADLVDPTGETYPPAWITLAEVQYATGRTEEAIESYKGIARFPGYEKDAYMALAEIYQQMGDIDNALDALSKVQRYVPPGDPTVQALINQLRSQR